MGRTQERWSWRVALVAGLLTARVASALTFCVDVGGASCDVTGTGAAGFQTALDSAATTAASDTVRLGIATYVGPFVYTPSVAAGTLTIVGAGIDQTVLTVAAPSTSFARVLTLRRDLVGNPVTVSQLTIVPPAPISTGGTIGIDTDGLVEDARVAAPPGGSGSRNGVQLHGTGSGVRRTVIDMGNATQATALQVSAGTSVTPDSSPAFFEDSSALNGVVTVEAFVPLRIARARVSAHGNRAISARGTTVTVDDALILVDGASALSVSPEGSPGALRARHVTVVGVGTAPGFAGMDIDASGGSGVATMEVSHSIFRNFQHASFRRATLGETATLAVSASIFARGTDQVVGTGDTTLTEPQPNLDVDPLLTADHHLEEGSPAIDAAFSPPLASDEPAVDLDGEPRIQDGNGDGIAARDMGAFEHPAVPPVSTTTTTLPGCVVEATFPSITCRLGTLADATAAGVPPGSLATKLQGLLEQATARVAAAQSARSAGRARVARKSLTKAAKALAAFTHRLGGRAARDVDPATATSLAAAATALREDVRTLRVG